MKPRRLLILILLITFIALVIDLPEETSLDLSPIGVTEPFTIYRPQINLQLGSLSLQKDLNLKKGLDLQGGTHVVLVADMSAIDLQDRQTALDSAKEIISNRVDLFGINEPVIQTSVVGEEYRILVELPGVTDVNQVLDLIGQTAQLDFRELSPTATEAATLADFIPTGLTGSNLKRSTVQFGSTGEPQVGLEFDSDGATQFAQITERNVDKPVAIFLDNYPVTIPRVNQKITGGQAVIEGQFNLDEAKNLSIQLNAGALPVPIQILEQKNIGATLGEASINQSLQAGAIGLSMVMLFMVLYYGRMGLIADIALIIYAIITLALYKLIPITLTLPGLAGFILSVGMAVDSNILIFERMKEELRAKNSWQRSMELGFGRAWDSIKDANVATLITAFILFNPVNWSFLNNSGMVRGFALTLTIGILVSLFTGIIVTRTLMRVFLSKPPKKYQIDNK
jgi:preprotein translocase subunit SecD